MNGFEALLDSDVVVASLVQTHMHHDASLALLTAGPGGRFAIAAHSMAEAFVTLTRAGGLQPFQIPPGEAVVLLDSVRAITGLVGLSPSQVVAAIRSYALRGGVGARLYDALIGEAAVVHGIPAVITWNVRHMVSLFPNLRVATPAEYQGADAG